MDFFGASYVLRAIEIKIFLMMFLSSSDRILLNLWEYSSIACSKIRCLFQSCLWEFLRSLIESLQLKPWSDCKLKTWKKVSMSCLSSSGTKVKGFWKASFGAWEVDLYKGDNKLLLLDLLMTWEIIKEVKTSFVDSIR